MKFLNIAATAAVIAGSSLSLNVAAHALWLEDGNSNTAGTKLYFGEFAENVRERSPGRLDSIIEPTITILNSKGEARQVTARPEGNHFAIPGDGTVLVQALRQPVREPQGEKRHPPQRRFLYARLGNGGSLPLDIRNNGDTLSLIFMGKPVAKAEIIVMASNGWEKHVRTDEKGEVAFSLPEPGLYVVEATHELDKSGEFEGKPYTVEVHRTTLNLYKQ